MALPLPRIIPDIGPGGGLVTSMSGINALANALHQKKINQVKAQYAPLTTQAEAASKLAYANLMAPQFMAKLLSNPSFLANLSEEQKNILKSSVYNAGTSPQGLNALNAIQQNQNNTPQGFASWAKNAFRNLLHPFSNNQEEPNNALLQSTERPFVPRVPNQPNMNERRPEGAVMREGDQWYDKNGNPVYGNDEESDKNPMELEVNEGNAAPRQKTYSENAGEFIGTQKEGEKLGELRAKAIQDIGEQQLLLSNTGANLDRLIDDFTNPDFTTLREDIPFLQDKQLKLLAHTGTPQQRNLIGKIIADMESFKGSTVNSFKGQTLKREFDYAEQLKPSENDTVYTALGKLQSLKALHDIAEEKNDIISDLMENKHYNLTNAVKKANKMVDIKGIEKQAMDLTSPMITIRNPKTGERLFLTKARAEELGIKNGK